MCTKNYQNSSASNCTRQPYCLRNNEKHDARMNTHISDGKCHNLLIFYTNVEFI